MPSAARSGVYAAPPVSWTVGARGALADDMRTKLLLDLAYVAGLERFGTFIRTELWVIIQTPWVMLRGLGR